MTQWGIDTLFNPGKRHMDEEKRRLQSTREEIGDSSGGKRIDLEGGKVRLADKSATDETAPDEEASTDQAEESGTDQAEESEESEDSPAARARRRRRNV
jgi:hypothetical protein